MKYASVLLVALIGVVGVPAAAQKVKVEPDPKADFSQLKSYAWKRGMPAPYAPTDLYIQTRVEEELSARGFHKVEQGQPDFYVVYFAGLNADVSQSTYVRPGVGAELPKSVPAPGSSAYLTGSLVIEMVDVGETTVLWRGVARDTLEGTGERAAKKIDKAINKLFKKFPPKPR